ncbi:MAG: hypothetical protein IJ335_02550 [Lachnospiraceae bacterium]|nr:hypothetical protein [Lachnospiraceae bacterium]
MLNEERVILMTKMASYEATDGKKHIKAGNFFRGDYLSIEVMKSLVYGTLAFALGFGLYVLYDFEVFMQDIYKMDLFVFIQNILIYYAVFIVIYGVVSYFIYSYRYKQARIHLKRYYQNLKKLSMLYQKK